MTTIFAVGGGEIARGETEPIDRAILAATGVDDPRVLFLPTASGDADGYIETFESYFGDTLGCRTDVLGLVGTTHIDAASAEKISEADAIYVGGGDTAYMLEVWRARGIDDLLEEAWRDGTVMAGLSAGAICWFAGGLGDVVAAQGVDYGPVGGLGLVPGLRATPHATPDRRDAFADDLSVRGIPGVALENRTALEVAGDRWRVHASSATAAAYRVPPGGDAEEAEMLPSDGTYRPLSELR